MICSRRRDLFLYLFSGGRSFYYRLWNSWLYSWSVAIYRFFLTKLLPYFVAILVLNPTGREMLGRHLPVARGNAHCLISRRSAVTM